MNLSSLQTPQFMRLIEPFIICMVKKRSKANWISVTVISKKAVKDLSMNRSNSSKE